MFLMLYFQPDTCSLAPQCSWHSKTLQRPTMKGSGIRTGVAVLCGLSCAPYLLYLLLHSAQLHKQAHESETSSTRRECSVVSCAHVMQQG
jgi:hypothetical protein